MEKPVPSSVSVVALFSVQGIFGSKSLGKPVEPVCASVGLVGSVMSSKVTCKAWLGDKFDRLQVVPAGSITPSVALFNPVTTNDRLTGVEKFHTWLPSVPNLHA